MKHSYQSIDDACKDEENAFMEKRQRSEGLLCNRRSFYLLGLTLLIIGALKFLSHLNVSSSDFFEVPVGCVKGPGPRDCKECRNKKEPGYNENHCGKCNQGSYLDPNYFTCSPKMVEQRFPGDFWAAGYINPNGISSVQVEGMECWHAVLTGLLGTAPPGNIVASTDEHTTIAELLRLNQGLPNFDIEPLVENLRTGDPTAQPPIQPVNIQMGPFFDDFMDGTNVGRMIANFKSRAPIAAAWTWLNGNSHMITIHGFLQRQTGVMYLVISDPARNSVKGDIEMRGWTEFCYHINIDGDNTKNLWAVPISGDNGARVWSGTRPVSGPFSYGKQGENDGWIPFWVNHGDVEGVSFVPRTGKI